MRAPFLSSSESRKLEDDLGRGLIMDGLTIIGFVFGMLGVVALVRLEKLIKTLKEKGILEEDYRKE